LHCHNQGTLLHSHNGSYPGGPSPALKRDAVRFCFGESARVEHYPGELLANGRIAADGRCELSTNAETGNAAIAALQHYINQVVAHRHLILEQFMTSHIDFVVDLSGGCQFAVDIGTLARIALIPGRLEVRAPAT
jgi:hypothetical protein